MGQIETAAPSDTRHQVQDRRLVEAAVYHRGLGWVSVATSRDGTGESGGGLRKEGKDVHV